MARTRTKAGLSNIRPKGNATGEVSIWSGDRRSVDVKPTYHSQSDHDAIDHVKVAEPSDAAAVRSDGATNGGSHDPSRVEPSVVAMKKWIRGKTAKEGVCEISGPSSGDNDS
jgi:hypothetical protein